ncbi:hypothetical protein PSEEN3071 [Pseudomonas entomophila L48]|uniref:Uncharacterized protein n=1 Tax=Pseudomonas entomophila (strain L48) TaxID=384676 RepID=Q1I938_PSEE4|nr:hypothetical protein PSEEN3071 [Pseudomonas entomophila L48]
MRSRVVREGEMILRRGWIGHGGNPEVSVGAASAAMQATRCPAPAARVIAAEAAPTGERA